VRDVTQRGVITPPLRARPPVIGAGSDGSTAHSATPDDPTPEYPKPRNPTANDAAGEERQSSDNVHADAKAAGHAKAAVYRELAGQLEALLSGETDATANAANAAAAIYHALPRLNWVGFYFLRDDMLVLGPFQGRPACVRISLGHGVCGTAARDRRSVLVPDVHAFPGHIACDADSRSELVVPLRLGESILGVLDLDSPDLARFDAEDQTGCERLAAIVVRHLA
jgi:GAF domain-containing protein